MVYSPSSCRYCDSLYLFHAYLVDDKRNKHSYVDVEHFTIFVPCMLFLSYSSSGSHGSCRLQTDLPRILDCSFLVQFQDWLFILNGKIIACFLIFSTTKNTRKVWVMWLSNFDRQAVYMN